MVSDYDKFHHQFRWCDYGKGGMLTEDEIYAYITDIYDRMEYDMAELNSRMDGQGGDGRGVYVIAGQLARHATIQQTLLNILNGYVGT